jgi:toxin ParE1/3/4
MVWRTTDEADFDLQFIVEQGTAQFGRHASGAYLARVIDLFETLAVHPYIGSERATMRGAVRLMPCGSHNILYIVDDEDVIILRVLHGLQDWFELL